MKKKNPGFTAEKNLIEFYGFFLSDTYADGAVRYGSLLVRIAELVQCMLQHNLAIGLLLTAHPELKVPQLFDELIAECIKEK